MAQFRTFQDFDTQADADAFRATVADRNPRQTTRRSWIGRGRNRNLRITFVVNFDD